MQTIEISFEYGFFYYLKNNTLVGVSVRLFVWPLIFATFPQSIQHDTTTKCVYFSGILPTLRVNNAHTTRMYTFIYFFLIVSYLLLFFLVFSACLSGWLSVCNI